jgi:hypothetical protein
MPLVHVTTFEDPIEVPDDEVPVLRAQGLLREDPAPAAAPSAVAKPTPKKDGES